MTSIIHNFLNIGDPTRVQKQSPAGETPPKSQSVFIESYGCQMNEYDSGIVLTLLERTGFYQVKKPEEAGVILLNTCAVRENAQQRIYGRLRSLGIHKREDPDVLIGVLGCMAQSLGDDFFAMGLPVDLVLGPDNYRMLGETIRRIREDRSSNIRHTRISRSETYEDIAPAVVQDCRAFVTVMRGCNNFCAFCIVPYTRGRERSKPSVAVIDEVNRLVTDRGVGEITLLGQNVNSYREAGSGLDFTGLVKLLLEKTEVRRIRFTSPHPHDFPRHLLELMAAEPRFCSHIHLPLQSGSTSVLERMNRDYSREDFLRLVEEIRDIVGEDVGLTTDVIVGFPGETEEQFQETLSLMEIARFDMAFMFHYSLRPGTPAARKMKDDIPLAEKKERLQRLIDLQLDISARKNRTEHGRIYEVLVEGPSKRSTADWTGRTPHNKTVVFAAPEGEGQVARTDDSAGDANVSAGEASVSAGMVGREISVRITDSTSATLRGRVV